MIGLQRGAVQLSSSQEAWKEAFETERGKLLSQSSDLISEIYHVGSTSIPGLDAKPIIDMAVVVESFEVLPELSSLLSSLAWIDRGWVRDDNYLFVLDAKPEFRTHHMHVVQPDSSQLREYLVFKEALIREPSLLNEYVELKRELEQRYSEDRKSYTAGKDEFIRSVLSRSGLDI